MGISLLIAGIAAGTNIYSAISANAADKEAAELEKYQNLLDVATFESDIANEQYNLSVESATLASSQRAAAAAMGKRSAGGSVGAIIETGKEEYARDIERLGREAERAKAFGKVTRSSIDALSSSRTKQRNIQAAGQGLMSIAKVFADT